MKIIEWGWNGTTVDEKSWKGIEVYTKDYNEIGIK